MSHRYWTNQYPYSETWTRTWEPGSVLGNLDLHRSLVRDPYSGTWIRTREPVLVYVLKSWPNIDGTYCILIENIFLGHGNQMEVMEDWLWLDISDQHISKSNHGIFRAFEMLQSENFCVLHWNFISSGPDCIPNSDLHFDERHWKSCGKFYWLAKWVGGIFTPTYPHRWQPNRGW